MLNQIFNEIANFSRLNRVELRTIKRSLEI
jgi:hypothetical protein